MPINQRKRLFALSQDIVFKSFFSRNKQVLHSLLKSFLPLHDDISNITIINPEPMDKQAQKKSTRHSSHTSAACSDKQAQKTTVQQPFTTQKNPSQSLPENQDNLKLSFKQTALLPDAVDSKHFVLDLIVELNNKKTINIEMQSALHRGFLKRILLYWARLHSQSLNKGEDYSKVTPTYSLIFTKAPVLSQEIEEFTSSFSIKRDKKPFVLLNEDLKIVIVELSKLKRSSFDELIDLQEKWCYFLRESSALKEEERRLFLKDREMNKAMKHLEELSRDKELLYKALSRENSEMAYRLDKQGWIEEGLKEGMKKGEEKGMKEGMKKGEEKGMKEGMKKGEEKGLKKGMKKGEEEGMKKGEEKGLKKGEEKAVRKLILKMLREAVDKTFISKLTGLSEDEIIKLKSQED